MISTILFVGLIIIGVCLLGVYNYIALWRISKETENREKLGWYCMFCVSTAVFCLLIAWRIKVPLAKDFLPVFFIFSLILGFLARESATSPYKLAKFWKKLGTKTDKNSDNR
jgi:hypothetical protein